MFTRLLACSTVAKRTPSNCCACADMPSAGAAAGSASPASPPYLGTNCMSMNGDLPGWSKRCVGTIGSYQ